MDSNHRCLGVGQESSPLDHGTVFLQKVDLSGVAPESPVCRTGVFLLDHKPLSAEAVGLEPTIRLWRTTCFQNRLLIRPDDFQNSSCGMRVRFSQATFLRTEKLRGLESNQRPPGSEPGVAYQQQPPRSVSIPDSRIAERFGEEDSNLRRLLQRQAAYR